jgi:tRNA-binding EMAP/Myf-like protein
LKEKPMAEAAAGGGGSGAADSGGGEKKPKPDPRKKEVAPVADSGAEVGDVVDISWADIRVGKIVDAVPHPESDKLYVETIDLGDESPRQILSASDNLPECMLIASLIR